MSAWWQKSTNGAGHSSSPPLFALLEPRPEPPALTTLKDWLASWSGIGAIIAGMTRQGFNVEVRQFPEGWRANFYPAGLAHSIVAGTAWEPTPWAAVQRAAWTALRTLP